MGLGSSGARRENFGEARQRLRSRFGARGSDRETSNSAESAEMGQHGRVRVVVVDDQPNFRDVARHVLTGRGYEVVAEVPSAAAALEAVERYRPDAMLLDVQLGDDDGFALCNAVTRIRPELAVMLTSAENIYERVPEPFHCQVKRGRTSAVVEVTGELDLATVEAVRHALQSVIQEKRWVTLDLRGLKFMDGAGLNAILEVDAMARQDGFNFAVVKPPETVQLIFRISGVEDHLAFIDAPEDLAPAS